MKGDAFRKILAILRPLFTATTTTLWVAFIVWVVTYLYDGAKTPNEASPYLLTTGAVLVLMNVYFMNQFRVFIGKPFSRSETYYEFLSIFVTGISNIFIFSAIYYQIGLYDGESIVRGSFVTSTYFSIVTWTTLGYGDLQPIGLLRLVAAIEALLGYLYMALFVGLLIGIIQSKNSSEPK